MGKITFGDDEDTLYADAAANEALAAAADDVEPEPSSSEESAEEDSDVPEAVSSKTAKAAQKNQDKLERLAQQEQSRKRKRDSTTAKSSQASKESAKKSARPAAAEPEESESEAAEGSGEEAFQPVASTSTLPAVSAPAAVRQSVKFDEDEDAMNGTAGRLPADLFAQAALEEEAQRALEQEAHQAKASLKTKAKKRKAAALPDVGSSVTLPRGDKVQHLANQDNTPHLTPANPRARPRPNPNSLIAPFRRLRKVHQTASATKHAADGSNKASVRPKKDARKASAWKDRTEDVRRSAALVAARQGRAGISRGFVSGQLSKYS